MDIVSTISSCPNGWQKYISFLLIPLFSAHFRLFIWKILFFPLSLHPRILKLSQKRRNDEGVL